MTSSPPLVEPLAARDGCDCPPWVIRCAHYEGRGVVLVTPHGTNHDHHCDNIPFNVFMTKEWIICPRCGDLIHDHLHQSRYRGHDADEALAAFYAAEEALLAGAGDD